MTSDTPESNETSHLLARAEQRFQDGDIEGAINLCAEVLNADPNNGNALLQVGLAAKALGEIETAERHIRMAATHAGAEARPYIELAQLMIDTERFGEAERTLAHAISVDRSSIPAHRLLGRIHHLKAEFDTAVSILEKAVALDPGDAETQFYLGRTLAEIDSRSEDATLCQRRAIELSGYLPEYVWPAVNWHLIREERTIAEEYLRNLIARRPRMDPAPYYVLGKILNQEERSAEATEVLQVALSNSQRLSPTQHQTRHDIDAYRGRILHEMGRRAEAKDIFRQIGRSTPVERFEFDPAIYPAGTPARLKRLENIVRNRDVAILCHGPSIGELEKRISRLKDRDICYVSINRFAVVETHILGHIDTDLDIIAETAPSELSGYLERVTAFLGRAANNLMITSRQTLSTLPDPAAFEAEHGEKLLYYDMRSGHLPTPANPLHFLPGNTLSVVLPLIQVARPSRIFLFGADGHIAESGNDVYYRNDSREFADGATFDEQDARDRLVEDTAQFNDICDLQMLCLAGLFGVPEVPVFNCSANSHYRPYRRMTLDAGLDLLLQ